MALLAVDTSSPYASLAVQTVSGIQHIGSTSENSHIESLSQLFSDLLNQAGLKPSDLTGILIGAGPGSFTGLRIGFAFVSGLLTELKLPFLAISSLKAACYQSEALRHDTRLAKFDARRGEYYACLMQGDNIILDDQICSEEQLANYECPLVSNTRIAEGLINYQEVKSLELTSFDPFTLSKLSPNYLRSVAAVKIKDRA